MPPAAPRIAVLMTLDSKLDVARYFCDALQTAGAEPWIMDLSLRAHDHDASALPSRSPLAGTNATLTQLQGLSRGDASQIMIDAWAAMLSQAFASGDLAGAIGVGGANGSTMACGIMRELTPDIPKAMVTPVAATAAVQWYVAQSDIAMFPTIGDISLNRITRTILDNAAHAIVGMSRAYLARKERAKSSTPLIGVSTFGNLQVTVDRITAALEDAGAEVIHFHASGPGGKALESLTRAGELTGLIDLTTSELADFINGGVYSAGPDRMTAAAETGIPQIVVPGCLDFTNWWVGEVPQKYHDREFYQYNQEILLMRTNAEEYTTLAGMFVERLSAPNGPFRLLIPKRGFSKMTEFPTHDLSGLPVGSWSQSDCDQVFCQIVRQGLADEHILEVDLHINDPEFADRAVAELGRILPGID